MISSIIIGIIIVIVITLLDQGSKALAVSLLMDKTVEIIPGVFRLELTFNTGAAFGSMDGKFWLLMLFTAVATIVFIYMARYAHFKKAPWYSTGIYFMIGGMIGNFIDRAFAPERSYAKAHAVTDFFSFYAFKSEPWYHLNSIFNVADIFLCIGVALIIIDILFFERKRKNNG